MMVRRQLTLFVPLPAAQPLEAVRRVVDPVQAGLIAAHVTLCREDELASVDDVELARRLAASTALHLTLTFGPAERFDGHGLLLPCIAGEAAFRELREQVLGSHAVRRQVPHLTLAHPRNPIAPGNSLEFALATLPPPLPIIFTAMTLIEQVDRQPWRIL